MTEVDLIKRTDSQFKVRSELQDPSRYDKEILKKMDQIEDDIESKLMQRMKAEKAVAPLIEQQEKDALAFDDLENENGQTPNQFKQTDEEKAAATANLNDYH